MSYEEESEYVTSYFHCIDPIENLKIKIVIKPVKNLHIPLPQFDADEASRDLSIGLDENQTETEEYTFKWQEKIFSKCEIKKHSAKSDWKKKLCEKYNDSLTDTLNNLNNYPKKLFSYVDIDNFSVPEKDLNIFEDGKNYVPKRKNSATTKIGQSMMHFSNIPKRKIINYYPSQEFKNQSHINNKRAQKMFIMIDLGLKTKNSKAADNENYECVLCALSYDHSSKVLEMTPSFSCTKPYIVGVAGQDERNSYYYWLYHASLDISPDSLTKETKIMNKIFDHHLELRKLQIGTEFDVARPNCFFVTLLGEISSAKDFEYDYLHIHYFMKLPPGWECENDENLIGTTHTSHKNSYGILNFSHLFEMNFFVDLKTLEDSTYPELFFEVLSVDKYNRYRNEGYTCITVPSYSGMFEYNLRCWRALDKTVKSKLQRFFVGGGPELEDVSYVGLSTPEEAETMSRFGFETIPSGEITVKLNIIHQSEIFKGKKGHQTERERNISGKLNAEALLGSVNVVLEAFRRARERMLQAKKGLNTEMPRSWQELCERYE